MDTAPSSLLTDRELAAWRGMLEAHSALVAELDAELERDHGLPLSSYEVLMYLGDARTASCGWASSPTGCCSAAAGSPGSSTGSTARA